MAIKNTGRRRWKKGESPNPAGRPKGAQNKVTLSARATAQALLDQPAYRAALAKAVRTRTLEPQLEAMLWHYAHGKPKEAVDVSVTFDHLAYLTALSAPTPKEGPR